MATDELTPVVPGVSTDFAEWVAQDLRDQEDGPYWNFIEEKWEH